MTSVARAWRAVACVTRNAGHARSLRHGLYSSVAGGCIVFIACAGAGPVCDPNHDHHGVFSFVKGSEAAKEVRFGCRTPASSYCKTLPTSSRHRTTIGGSVSPQKAAPLICGGGGGPL